MLVVYRLLRQFTKSCCGSSPSMKESETHAYYTDDSTSKPQPFSREFAVLTSSTEEAGGPLGFDDGVRHGTDGEGLAKEGKAPNSSTSIAVWRRCARSNLRPVWLRPRLPSSDLSSVTCEMAWSIAKIRYVHSSHMLSVRGIWCEGGGCSRRDVREVPTA